ncbi:glycerol-3-phosphate 1-O-acyltransferase PlsY [Chloroflexota bacterium]
MIIAKYVAVVLIGYLIGSIPFGLLISRRSTGIDLRKIGSGKIGTTNVLRTAGRKAAALVLLLDIAKGALPVVLAGLIFGESYYLAQVLAALAAIAGHSWSVFLGFKGGRGVATFLGGLFALHWPAAVTGGAIMILISFRTRYMSLGSITGAVSAFILLMVLCIMQLNFLKAYPPIEYVIYAMIGAIFIYVMHHDNIIRLISGTERKLGEKAEADNPNPSGNHE